MTVQGPERVVTRTVTVQASPTGPTHVGFSGGNFSSDEINSLAGKVVDMQLFPYVRYDGQESPRLNHSRILDNDRGYIFPKLIPSISEGNVSYTLKTYSIEDSLEYENRNIFVLEDSSDITTNDGWKIFDLTSPTDITGLGLSDTFTYKLFKGEVDPRRRDTTSSADDSKFHAEVATDYASDNTEDHLHFGWWMLVPKQTDKLTDYDLGVFADANHEFNGDPDIDPVTGTATYAGSMMGLHTDIDSNGKHTLSRFTGKATLTANFRGAGAGGRVTGTFDELKLNGTAATGSITFRRDLTTDGEDWQYLDDDNTGRAIINSVNYKGTVGFNWVNSSIQDTTDQPTGIIGVLKGITSDGRKAFTAAFGARKE